MSSPLRRTIEKYSKVFGILGLCLIVGMMTGCPGPAGPAGPLGGAAPGLNVEVLSVTIPADLMPEILLDVTDDYGNAIPLNEFTDIRFALGYLPVATAKTDSSPRFVNYILNDDDQATYDPARLSGASQNSDGTLTYKLSTALPVNFNPGLTHQVAGQMRRTYPATEEAFLVNPVYAFVPNGSAVTNTREVSTTDVCNNCHTRLQLHGSRREYQYCIMCHNEQSIDPDTGNSVDMTVLIHKIHMGEDLPSVQDGEPYQIIGFRDSVHDYSDVVFPQSVQNCTVCHQEGADAGIYLTEPSMAACGSCHDRTWFGDPTATPVGYVNHPLDFEQTDDSNCISCHSDAVIPIDESHQLPVQSISATGLALDITDVAADPATGEVTITYVVTDGNGDPLTDLTTLDLLQATIAWPAEEYAQYNQDRIYGFGTVPAVSTSATGEYTHTFADLLPTGTGDTFAVAMEGRIEFDVDGETHEQGTATNGFTTFTLDGSDTVARRTVVDEDACNDCHAEIRMHGELRTGVDFCLMCHNANLTDVDQRLAGDEENAVTANFKDMIHKIHMGAELENGYSIYGFGNTEHDYSEVEFPGIINECSMCHGDNDISLPLPEVALPTTVDNGVTDPMSVLPETASCTSCHDGILTLWHAVAMSPSDNETCSICHGPGAEFDVEVVHDIGN